MLIVKGKPIAGFAHVPEGCHFDYREGLPILILSFPRPTPDEVQSIARGPMALRLLGSDLALCVLFRFGREGGGLPWSDAIFEWHRVAPEQRVLPELDDLRAWLVLLLDSGTQCVQAIRYVTPDAAFQRALWTAMRAQAARPAPDRGLVTQYVHALQSLSSAQLAAAAAREPAAPHTLTATMASFRSGN